MGAREVVRLRFPLALLLVLAILNQQLVSGEDKCKSGCRGGKSQTFKYVEGTTYTYNLDGTVDVTLSNAEGQQSNTKIKAVVSLTQLPQCNQLLKLSNVQLFGPDAKKYTHIDGIEKPIQLNFHDGHIEDSICAEPGDNQNSLNIKRAVASIFQSGSKQNYETDVFGVCPTETNTHKEGSNVVVRKTKLLNKCSHRESIKQDFVATVFNLNSEIKTSPILNGEYNSEAKIKNGILDSAVITENYLFVPFSIGKNGAKATVTTKLTYAGTAKKSANSKVSEKKSIIFENPHLVNTQTSNADSILSALKAAKDTINLTVGDKSARLLNDLIKVLRVSNKDDILSVYGQVRAGAGFKDKATAKKVYLDAIIRAGTGDTIEVAIELLKNKELDVIEQKLVYLSLAFAKHATLNSIKAATALLDYPNLPREGFLGVGTLARKYCQEHSCNNVPELNALISKLSSKLSVGQIKNKQQENQAVASLKALGNVDQLNDEIVSKILLLAQEKSTSSRVRVAALETLLVEACKEKVRDGAVQILKNIQEDSEIRIKAYLLIAKCPNGKVANVIKTLLDQEPSFQVGGYIVSHLRNLKASANPDKQLAKHFLSQISTTKRFPIDLRKYSFYNDLSYTADTLGAASSLESSVIYSQSSFLPRSTDLNLTTQLFGHSFNFLEIGTRQENLEKVLEHYLGPLGVLEKSAPEELVKSGKGSLEKLLQHIHQRLQKTRGKRDVSKQELDHISKQVQIKGNQLNSDLDLDLSIKAFGSELIFLSLNDQSEKYTPDVVVDKIFDALDEGIDKARNFEKLFQSNVLFLDVEISYPTSLGFALKLNAEGTSALQLKASGSIDVRGLANNQNSSPLKLSLIPSANIDIVGSLVVDAQVVQGGLKVTSSVYTATGGDLEVVQSNGGKSVDVKFSLPVQNQKLISATHEVVFHARELGKSEVIQPIKFGQNKDFSICIDQLSTFIGVQFCADINSPPVANKHGTILPFPLSGNAKLSVGIEREDLSHIHIQRQIYSEDGKIGGEFLIETIGAQNQKKLGVELQAYIIPEPHIKASLVSQILSASLEGKVINNAQEKSLSLELKHDRTNYLGKIGVTVSGNQDKTIYTPLLVYQGPGQAKFPVNVEGSVIVEQKDANVKYTFDNVRLVSENPRSKPISLQGNLGREGNTFFSDVTVSDGTNSGTLTGKLRGEANNLNVNVQLKNTINPYLNAFVKYELKRDQNRVDSNLQLIHGPDLASKTQKLTLINSFNLVPKSLFETKNKLAYPALNLESSFDLTTKPKYLEYDTELQYGNLKLGSELKAQVDQKHKGDYDIELEAYGFNSKINIKAKREINKDSSRILKSLALNDNKFEVSGTVKHHYVAGDINIGSDLVVKVPGHVDALKIQTGLVRNLEELDAHAKIYSGSNVYVDSFIKATKGGNANGNLKLSLKNLIVANGQIIAANGEGNGNVVVELVRLNRKIKVDSTFTISEPTYNVALTLYPNFEKDTHKLVLISNNQIKTNYIDSKNTAELFGKKFEININGQLDGQLQNGKLSTEVEIILPTNLYLAGKLNREIRVVDGIANGNAFLSLEQRPNKNTPGAKLTITGQLKDTNFKLRLFDLTYNLVAENGHGKILNSDLNLKRLLQGDQIVLDIVGKAYGSVLQNPVDLHISSQYKGLVGTYNVQTKYGSKVVLSVNGKYDLQAQNNDVSGNTNIELTTPSSSIRISADGSSAYLQEKLKLKGYLSLYVDDNGSNPDAKVDIKLSGEAVVGPQSGNLKGSVNLPKREPAAIDLQYSISEQGKAKQLNGQLSASYGNNQYVKSELTLARLSEHEEKIDLALSSSSYPATSIKLYSKRSEDEKQINNEIVLNTNSKQYALTNYLSLSKSTPGFELKLVLPDGKVDEISTKLNIVSEKKLGGNLKLAIGQTNFLLEGNSDINIENLDNFVIKSSTNSPALKLNNLIVEISNKPIKGGSKKIQVSIQLEGQNVVSGSTNYKARQEGDKYIVEGSGSFKVKNEDKQGSFKLVRQVLSLAKNGEEGFELSVNAGLGNKAIDGEFKLTNKQFKILKSYCEEKQQCAHIDIDSKIDKASGDQFEHELEIAVDLRKLGLSHEFGLKGVTNRKNFILDHSVDVYFQNKQNKYQYSLYIHPSEAGIQLTTPKRIVALEAKNLQGSRIRDSLNGEIVLYLDKKNKPDQKTVLNVVSSYKGQVKNADYHYLLKLTSPALKKDLLISYDESLSVNNKNLNFNLIIDILPIPNQKIVVSGNSQFELSENNAIRASRVLQIKSEGLKVDLIANEELLINLANREIKYSLEQRGHIADSSQDSGIVVQVNRDSDELSVKLLNQQLINVKSRIQQNADNVVLNTDVNVAGVPPLISVLEVRNYNSLKYTVSRRDRSSDKLVVDANYISGDSASVNALVNVGGRSEKLVSGKVALDQKTFLKTDYEISSNNFQKYVLVPLKEDVSRFTSELKVIGDNSLKTINVQLQKVFDLLRQNSPSLKSILDYYKGELQQIREELLSDKTVKQLGEFLKGVFGAFVSSVEQIVVTLNEVTEKLLVTLKQQLQQISEAVKKHLVPLLNTIVETALKVVTEIVEQLTSIVAAILGKINVIIEGHSAELKQIVNTLTGIFQEIGQYIYNFVQQSQTALTKEWKKLSQEIQKLPIAEELKAKYKQYLGNVEVPEVIINTVKQIFATIKDAVPSTECKKFVGLLGDYVNKKLKGENVDDAAAIQNILQAAAQAFERILKTLSINKDIKIGGKNLPLSVDLLYNVPKLVAAKFSPLNYLINRDLPSATELIPVLSLNPKDWVPPYKLDAVVAQGQHIFTFDGRHLTFPGDCNYLFAQDALNANFSIAGTYKNGHLASLTFSDKQNIVTLKNNGHVLLNNAAVELPINKASVNVYRNYESFEIVAKAGVKILCGPELEICGIHVSGYYHGQLRGLLGNGNFEPYDDFTLPNGKIVTSESDLGNAYKLTSSCADINTVDHSAHHNNPACNKLFASDSAFSICYKFVNPDNYKLACNHGIAANVPNTERAIAIAYVVSCRARNVPVNIPSDFVKCYNAEQTYSIGESFSVKTPGKAADIVVIVDQAKSNEGVYKEFVQPLLAQITTELGAKGINDVEFHIVGYGGENQLRSSHYTVAGKLTFKGRSPVLKFSEGSQQQPINTGCEKLDNFLEAVKTVYKDIQLVSGQTLQESTYANAFKYPFRSHAVKSIIAVVSKPCQVGNLLALQKLRSLFFSDKQIALTLVTPIENFVAKDAKVTKNVIGFDARNVFTQTDAKKKPEGSSELHGELNYDDYCIDFTLKSRGNVFVANNFVQAKGSAKKQFVQTAAHNIVQKLVNYEQGLDCVCKTVSPYSAQNVCSVVYSNEKSSKKGHKGK